MKIIFPAKCCIFEPNYRIIRAQFDVADKHREFFGEYIVTNLLRERGVLIDGRMYQITIDPLFPH